MAADVSSFYKVNVLVNEAAITDWALSETGTLVGFLRRVGNTSKLEARKLAQQRLSPVSGPRVRAGTYPGQRRDWHRPDGDGRTGEYDKLFFYRTIPQGRTRILVVGNSAPYARFVELGSKPAIIRHREGRRLVLPGPVFLGRGVAVSHPGVWGSSKYKGQGARILLDAAITTLTKFY